MFIVSKEKLGLPQSSRDSFEILNRNGFITDESLAKTGAILGFRNIVMHDYQRISLPILQKIIECHLDDFRQFFRGVRQWT